MFIAHRHQQILDYVAPRKSVSVGELHEALRISMSTLRRDVQLLDDQGLLRRIHGGVMLVEDRPTRPGPPALPRSTDNSEAKRRIGEAAAVLVADGDTIIITGGTTTAAMIPFLAAKTDLTVITNALDIAYRLAEYPRIALVILGGWLEHTERFMLGHLTEQALQDLHAARIFHGVHGLDADRGLSGVSLQAVQTDRRIIAHARDLVILADGSKFGRIAPVRMAPIGAASTVVTDMDAPEAMVQALRAQGITVVQA